MKNLLTQCYSIITWVCYSKNEYGHASCFTPPPPPNKKKVVVLFNFLVSCWHSFIYLKRHKLSLHLWYHLKSELIRYLSVKCHLRRTVGYTEMELQHLEEQGLGVVPEAWRHLCKPYGTLLFWAAKFDRQVKIFLPRLVFSGGFRGGAQPARAPPFEVHFSINAPPFCTCAPLLKP